MLCIYNICVYFSDLCEICVVCHEGRLIMRVSLKHIGGMTFSIGRSINVRLWQALLLAPVSSLLISVHSKGVQVILRPSWGSYLKRLLPLILAQFCMISNNDRQQGLENDSWSRFSMCAVPTPSPYATWRFSARGQMMCFAARQEAWRTMTPRQTDGSQRDRKLSSHKQWVFRSEVGCCPSSQPQITHTPKV